MNAQNTTLHVIRPAAETLSLHLVRLLYLILVVIAASSFYQSDCLIFGPEQIAGAQNCGYHDDGGFYYTNPMGMLFRHILYMLLIAALTWFSALGCESLRLPSSPCPIGFKKNLHRLLFACLFAGIFIGIGNGILALTYQRNAELWKSVSAFHSLAEYENYFREAKYLVQKVNEEQFAQFVQSPRMCDKEFALGKELYIFCSAWPFRRFFVWLENGQIVKTTWCGGR